MAAADYAEGKIASPPPELKYAWQSHTYNVLPNSGGLRNQPHGLMLKMTACYNAWYAMSKFVSSDFNPQWIKNNPDAWKIVCEIETLRSKVNTVNNGE